MIGVVLLPQLLFFWLAPQDAAAGRCISWGRCSRFC